MTQYQSHPYDPFESTAQESSPDFASRWSIFILYTQVQLFASDSAESTCSPFCSRLADVYLVQGVGLDEFRGMSSM